MHCSDDFNGMEDEVPLVLVAAMATKTFSMDSAAGHFVSS